MDRVSTLNLHNIAISSSMNVQSQLAQAEVQESSGLVASDFGTLGGSQSRALLNLQSELTSAQSWSSTAQLGQERSQTMYSAVGNMVTQLTKLQTVLSSALSSIDNSNLGTQVQSLQDSLVQQMNIQYDGGYVFSGSDTATKPVNMSNYSSATISSSYDSTVQDFSYYQGDNADLSMQIDHDTTITYGVRAGVTTGTTPSTTDPANTFEMAIRATAAALQASGSTDSTTKTSLIQKAYDLAGSALNKMANLQESISAISSQFSTAQTNQTNYATLLQNSISNIKDVDTSQVASKVSQYQTQLQASYQALATVTKVNLASYL